MTSRDMECVMPFCSTGQPPVLLARVREVKAVSEHRLQKVLPGMVPVILIKSNFTRFGASCCSKSMSLLRTSLSRMLVPVRQRQQVSKSKLHRQTAHDMSLPRQDPSTV